MAASRFDTMKSHIEAKLAVAKGDIARYSAELVVEPVSMMYRSENMFHAAGAVQVCEDVLALMDNMGWMNDPEAVVKNVKAVLMDQIIKAAKTSIPVGDVPSSHMELILREERAGLLDEIEWM